MRSLLIYISLFSVPYLDLNASRYAIQALILGSAD